MKKLLLFTLLIGLFAGCKKTEVYPKEDYFYGKWRATNFNMEYEFISGGIVKTLFRNQGASPKVDVIGAGSWSFDTNPKNLKINIGTWTQPGLYDPMPGASKFDVIIDVIDANSFYMLASGSSEKHTRIL